MSRPLHIVDVFAERPYTGNPLAVVLDADGLSDETMQRFAAEMNFSETTYVSSAPGADGGYRVRIFTPARELAFAGHPILGTAWVIRRHLEPGAPGVRGPLRIDLMVGPVTVTFEASAGGADVAWFLAPPVSYGATVAAERIAPALGLSPADIVTSAPVQMLSSGTSAMIGPLRGLEALRQCRLDLAAYASLAAEGFPPLTYLFSRETRDPANDLSARFFFEAHGVREDPATGNGAAFLGAWLLEHGYIPGTDHSLRIEQGHEMNRPSLVRLKARNAGTREVHVGGSVVPVVQGEMV